MLHTCPLEGTGGVELSDSKQLAAGSTHSVFLGCLLLLEPRKDRRRPGSADQGLLRRTFQSCLQHGQGGGRFSVRGERKQELALGPRAGWWSRGSLGIPRSACSVARCYSKPSCQICKQSAVHKSHENQTADANRAARTNPITLLMDRLPGRFKIGNSKVGPLLGAQLLLRTFRNLGNVECGRERKNMTNPDKEEAQ